MKPKTGKKTGETLGRHSPRDVHRINDIHNSIGGDGKNFSIPTVTYEGLHLLSPKYRAIAEKLIQQGRMAVAD